MLKKKLDYLRELEIVREQKKYNKKKLVANGKDCSNISNAIRVCTEQIEEILDKNVLISNGMMSFIENENAQDYFINDLLSAQSEIRIDIPDKPLDDFF